jgi:hypothetical protein
MATPEELFISISPETYKRGKSETLIAQSDLLQTLKHLQNLKVLSRQRNDLKEELHKLFFSIITQVKSIQDEMPTPKIPKTVQHHEEPKVKLGEKKTFSKRDEIEEELREIHAKLQALNSQ